MSSEQIMQNLVKSGIDAYNMGLENGRREVMEKINDILDEIEAEQEKCIASEAHGNSFGLATAREIIRRHIEAH